MAEQIPDQPVIRVVILEDADVTMDGLLLRLTTSGIVILGASCDPGEILALVRLHQPDVAILDLRIYGDDRAGFKVARQISAISPTTRCIIYTEFDSIENQIAAQEIGVTLFAGKVARGRHSPPIEALVRAIVSSGAHETHPSSPLKIHPQPAPTPEMRPDKQRNSIELTPREQEALYWAGEGLSDKEITEEMFVQIGTVKKHLQESYRKIGIHRRWLAMEYARKHGLIPPPKSKVRRHKGG